MPITKVTIIDKDQLSIVREISGMEDGLRAQSEQINKRVKAETDKIQSEAKAEWEKIMTDADIVLKENFERLRHAMGMTTPIIEPRINVTDLDSNPPVATLIHGHEETTH